MLTRRQLVRARAPPVRPSCSPPHAARAKLLRGGRFSQGVLSGDPTPHGITLLDARRRRRAARGGVRLEVARDPHFRHVVARKTIATSAAHSHSVKARVRACGPRALLLPLRDARRALPGRALPDRAAAGLARAREVRVLLLRRLHARLLQRATSCMAREDSTSSSASATTSTPRPTTRSRGTGVRDDKIGKANRDNPRSCARPSRSTTTAPSTRSTAPTRRCATLHAKLPDGHDLGRPRGAGQLRRRRAPAAACRPRKHYSPPARPPPTRRSSRRCRSSAGRKPHLPRAALRRATST